MSDGHVGAMLAGICDVQSECRLFLPDKGNVQKQFPYFYGSFSDGFFML
jgi:hypothetical protein